jgi:hypothetical protein
VPRLQPAAVDGNEEKASRSLLQGFRTGSPKAPQPAATDANRNMVVAGAGRQAVSTSGRAVGAGATATRPAIGGSVASSCDKAGPDASHLPSSQGLGMVSPPSSAQEAMSEAPGTGNAEEEDGAQDIALQHGYDEAVPESINGAGAGTGSEREGEEDTSLVLRVDMDDEEAEEQEQEQEKQKQKQKQRLAAATRAFVGAPLHRQQQGQVLSAGASSGPLVVVASLVEGLLPASMANAPQAQPDCAGPAHPESGSAGGGAGADGVAGRAAARTSGGDSVITLAATGIPPAAAAPSCHSPHPRPRPLLPGAQVGLHPCGITNTQRFTTSPPTLAAPPAGRAGKAGTSSAQVSVWHQASASCGDGGIMRAVRERALAEAHHAADPYE